MKCSLCGADNPEHATSCSVCLAKLGSTKHTPGESFRRTPEFHTRVQSMIPKRKTEVPTATGGILILNAILAICGLWVTNVYIGEFHPTESDAMAPINLVFGGIAIFVMIGGILAMLRRAWVVTLAASIASFFLVLAFSLFCGAIAAMLSIAALVLLLQSRHEFAGHEPAD